MSDPEDEYAARRLKIVLVGDSGSGKTSIALKFCNNEFHRQYTSTAGVDFFLKNIGVGPYRNVNLYLWDVGGLALRGTMLDKYVFEASIILFVYDISNSASFDILEEWIGEVRRCIGDGEDEPLMAVVGNKCDVEHQRTVKRERSHRFAAENGFAYYDVSARTGETVSLCMATLAAQKLGVKLTKTDQESHKPIITAEIGDTVDMPAVQKVAKRFPNKKQHQITFHRFPISRSIVCTIQ